MTKYSYSQLETIWIDNGGNKAVAPIAAAIAMAESGGDSTATDNDSDGSTDRGLWQINSTHGSLSTYDVNGNAKAAISISSNGSNWNPWVTFQTGAYKKFLSGAAPSTVTDTGASTTSAGIGIPGLGGITSSISTIASAFKDVDTVLTDILNPAFWLRIASFLAGVLFVGAGVWCLVHASDNSPILPKNLPIPVPI